MDVRKSFIRLNQFKKYIYQPEINKLYTGASEVQKDLVEIWYGTRQVYAIIQ